MVQLLIKIHLGFGEYLSYFVKQKLAFDSKLTESQNLCITDYILQCLVGKNSIQIQKLAEKIDF